ncbi:MAG TPA: MCP four helix bundle domain-containing protein, partial [Myxococcales bacterium]|nr:MCP four helix bundle domain-containing protein [Myxococcales bacterium]
MRRDSILLAVAFIAVAAAFVASTVVAQRAAREVGGLAASIARDAAPGLASMSNVRSEVRRLQELVTRVAVLGTLSDERAEIDETRRNLDFHLAEFRSLPTSEQELKLLSQLQTDIRSFDEAVERVIAHLGSHQPEKAALVLSAELRPLADEAAAAASKLVQLDAKAAEGAALRIEEVHRRADRMALEMDTLCVLLAVVAAWLVAR